MEKFRFPVNRTYNCLALALSPLCDATGANRGLPLPVQDGGQHHDRSDSRGGFVDGRGRSSCCIHRGFGADLRRDPQ